MPAVKTYDFKNGNLIIIGGQRVGGFGEDGGIEYELATDTFEDVNGADDETTVSRMNDSRVYATITVMETSRSYLNLYLLWKGQKDTLIVPPMPFLHKDIINGDSTKEAYAVFMAPPVPSKARTAGERQFRILLPNGISLLELGTNNII